MTHPMAPWSARAILCALVLATAAFLALWLSRTPAPEVPFAGSGGEVSAESAYGELPLAFEPNAGPGEGGVDFVSRSASGTVLLDSDGATLALGEGKRAEAIGLELAGASAAEPRALERLPGVVNDLRGDDPGRWRTGIPTFERVRYPSVWPGIDLDWYGNQRQLEYDFRLAPGADPERIAIQIQGAERLRLAANGDLLIGAGTETIRQRAPVAYQPAARETTRRPVDAAFALSGETVRFSLGPYDEGRTLVIDPVVLAYSTYLGGNKDDVGHGIAVDSSGAAYVAGETRSTNFDTVGPIEGNTNDSDFDAFVSKLTPAGDALEYSTYLGGSAADGATGIAVDDAGAAYVTGETSSTDFNTVGAIEGDSPKVDAFVSKLTPAGGALEYSTYLGGGQFDRPEGIGVDHSGAAYVTGTTDSDDFDTVGEIEGDSDGVTERDAFVSKLSPAGSELDYSTYLGGSNGDLGRAIAVDSFGAAYITGETSSSDFNTVGPIQGAYDAFADAFVSKLTPAGDALEYSTYLGGSDFESGRGIAVDSSSAAYVTGETHSADFDTVGGGDDTLGDVDAFVSKLTPAGDALDYSRYLGEDFVDVGNGIGVDDSGAAYVTGGLTRSVQGFNPFYSRLSPDGSSASLRGLQGLGVGNAIAVAPSGSAYVTGSTSASNFETVGEIEGDSGGSDAFVSKFASCSITGTVGADTLVGTPNAETICGGGGHDVIVGLRGDDELRGDHGNDVLIGSRGDDTLDGGPGQDKAEYSADATEGVKVNLATGVVNAANLGIDTILRPAGLSSVERARGSQFDDILVGDGQDNELDGGQGHDKIIAAGGPDILIGAGGADTLRGERGDDRLGPGSGDDPVVSGGRDSDTLRYVNVSGGGVLVDLAAGIASALDGSDAGTDVLVGDIENAVGSPAHDELRAQLAGIASVLEGGDGADTLDTADGDALDNAKGGAGADDCTTDGGDVRSSCP